MDKITIGIFLVMILFFGGIMYWVINSNLQYYDWLDDVNCEDLTLNIQNSDTVARHDTTMHKWIKMECWVK